MSIPETTAQDKEVRREWGTGQNLAVESQKPGVLGRIGTDWVLIAVILLTGTLCLGLGILVGRENARTDDDLWIEQLPAEERHASSTNADNSSPVEVKVPAPVVVPESQGASVGNALPTIGTYMASKDGTKYYLPSCSGAKRIKEENIVWFMTKGDAEAAGYSAAVGCPGL